MKPDTILRLIVIAFLLAFVICFMSSCGRKTWQNRGIKKGWLDTTTHINTFEVKPDSVKKDTAVKKLADKIDSSLSSHGLKPMDSTTKEVVKEVLKREIEKVYIPMVYPDQEIVFEDGSKAIIGFKDGKLGGKFIYKPSNATPIIKKPWHKGREPWYLLTILLLLFLLIFGKRK